MWVKLGETMHKANSRLFTSEGSNKNRYVNLLLLEREILFILSPDGRENACKILNDYKLSEEQTLYWHASNCPHKPFQQSKHCKSSKYTTWSLANPLWLSRMYLTSINIDLMSFQVIICDSEVTVSSQKCFILSLFASWRKISSDSFANTL